MESKSPEKKKAPAVKKAAKPNNKKNKKRKKHPVLFTIFVLLFCLFVSGMLTGIIVGSSVLSHVEEVVEGKRIIDLDNYKNSQSQTSIMYAYNKKNKPVEIARLHGEENRIWVSYDEMPDNLLWAFVCLEDKRFYSHNGVDWIRTIGVMVKPSAAGQGGSTITQQLIKNLTDQKQVTYYRKFNEILRALNLEKYYSKKDILEAYLNTVYLGAGCYGVKTAAETYFGKSVDELNIGECAMLAGITKSPYSYNPYVNYDKAVARQQTCLGYMLSEGKLTEKQYNKWMKKKIKLVEKKETSSESSETKADILSWYDEYVIDQVIADLQSEYGYEYNEAWRMVYYGGLKIYSAVDLEIQDWVESVYENRSGFPSAYRVNDKLPQSSMTIMDYKGRIVALVGGADEKTSNNGYNRATDNRAKRQPGSSIKPLAVYAPAIDKELITPGSAILEKAITLNGREWPRNFNGDHGSGNYITAQEALVRSLNTVPVRILKEMLGVRTAWEYCNESFHLNLSSGDMDLSPLAVGGTQTGVTTLEMAAAFATFGNGGKYFAPYSYYKVVDRNGEIILDNTNNEPQQAIKTSTANQTLGMMTRAVVQSNGTAYGSKISGFQTFAKTGTTSDNCDKWYCGGTPYYVTAVWYGYDYPADLRTGGSNPAKTIFRYVFSEIHEGLATKTFGDVAKEMGGSASEVNKVFYSTIPVLETETETTEEETTTKAEKTTKKDDDETTTKRQSTTNPTTTKPSTTKPPETTKAPETTTAPPTTAPPTTTKPPETTTAPSSSEPQTNNSPEAAAVDIAA
ncbi:MAG: transglycosylase domain-containing protein [Clostridia bacterium]|nr:transglycosylase domain-containing protein [Clostridia bacterium]